MKKIFLLLTIIFIFINLFAVSAEDNETAIDDAQMVDETASPAISIETSVSDESIYIGNSTEATVTVRNVGNCDIDTLSIFNHVSLFNVSYDNGFYCTGEGDFEAYIKNPEFHYAGFESINGSWYTSYVDNDYAMYLSFILNETLKVNETFSFKAYYNTTKNPFHNFVNMYFFAFLDNITLPDPNFSSVPKTLLNTTFNKIIISQIPRTVYVNRTIQNDSLIVDAKVFSLDDSAFSGTLPIKVADLVMPEDQNPKMVFEKAETDFKNNTGHASLKLPLNITEQYVTGLIIGLPKYDVYSYNFVYDSFDESQLQPSQYPMNNSDNKTASPAVSIETSVSNSTIYIGNSTEVTVTVKNVGNCDLDNLSIVNIQSLHDVSYGLGRFSYSVSLLSFYFGFEYSKNPVFHCSDFESINGSWEANIDNSTYEERNYFILNDTLKVNQSCSFKVIYNTTKTSFYDYVNLHFFAFSDSTLLNKTFDKIKISQIPRNVYIYRKIQNDSLIVDAKVSSLDNSVFSGSLSIKVATSFQEMLHQIELTTIKVFENAEIDFINNTGSASLKLPLNTVDKFIYNGMKWGLDFYGVYAYKYIYDSFDENRLRFPSITIPDEPAYARYINVNDLVKVYKNDSQFIVNPQYLDCDNITFEVNGVTYVRQVNESGFAKLNINLNPGVYTIKSYINNHEYLRTNTITVLPTLIGENLVKYYRNGSQFDIKLVDSDNNPVASQNITFRINGVFYSRQTNDEGIARLNINLAPGEYVLTATDPITGLNMSYSVTVLPKLCGEDVIMWYGEPSNYFVKLVDDNGNAFPGQQVTFNINGLILNNVTGANGEAEIHINLMPGRYIVTAQYLDAKISNEIVILEK